MSLSLPNAKPEYDPQDEAQMRALVEGADAQNLKLGVPRILTSPNGTRWKESIDNAGAITWTAL